MDVSITKPLKAVGRKLKRFHVVIFVVSVFGGLAVAVFILSSILQASADTSSTMNTGGLSTTFDQKTIDQVNQLRTSQDTNNNVDFPSGRVNPFAE